MAAGGRLADRAALDKIQAEVKAEIDDARSQFALAAPYPSADEVEQDVYA